MTVEEALQREETIRGWGLERPGMSGYGTTERAVMSLASEVRRLSHIVRSLEERQLLVIRLDDVIARLGKDILKRETK